MKNRTSWPLVAEVLRHRQAREGDAQARARRLVHLAVDERDLVEHARLRHLEQEVVALARALAHAGEDGDAAVLLRDVVDELLDEDGLPDAGAAEEADLAALHVRGDEVDDLDARLERLDLRREVAELGRVAMDRPALACPGDRLELVDRLADHVPEPPERRLADRDGDRPVRCRRTTAPRERPSVESMATARTRSSPRCCCTSATSVRAASPTDLDLERRVDLGQPIGEDGVDDDALDLDDPARVRRRSDPFSDMVLLCGFLRRSGRPAGTSEAHGRARVVIEAPTWRRLERRFPQLAILADAVEVVQTIGRGGCRRGAVIAIGLGGRRARLTTRQPRPVPTTRRRSFAFATGSTSRSCESGSRSPSKRLMTGWTRPPRSSVGRRRRARPTTPREGFTDRTPRS